MSQRRMGIFGSVKSAVCCRSVFWTCMPFHKSCHCWEFLNQTDLNSKVVLIQ